MNKRAIRAALALATVTTIALAGCATTPADDSADGPVTLTMWAAASGLDQRVAIWNEANPDIQIELTKPGGGEDVPAKLLTATRAGDAPDIAQVIYSQLPSMVVGGVPIDITDYFADYKDKFTDDVAKLVTFDDKVYGVPQDIGPTAYLYRADKFEEYGIDVPTTWAEFATAAEKVHSIDPNVCLANYPGDSDLFVSLTQQAGAEWWSVDGDTWSVNIDSQASRDVADFWQDLADRGVICSILESTPDYNAALASGKILSMVNGVWAAGVLASIIPDTVGKWAGAHQPQWTPGVATVGYRGGSSDVITTSSKHPDQAAKFLLWLNASDEGAVGLTTINKFTAAIHGQEVDRTPPSLMPADDTYWPLAKDIASDTFPVQWGPNTVFGLATWEDEFSKAISNGTKWSDALGVVQDLVVKDLKDGGYKVEG